MSILQLCVCFILGYIFGNIPNGYLYAKFQGADIYHQGSGNPGSTNVLRTLGKRAGITVLLMDIAKCMVPIFLMILFLFLQSLFIRILLFVRIFICFTFGKAKTVSQRYEGITMYLWSETLVIPVT